MKISYVIYSLWELMYVLVLEKSYFHAGFSCSCHRLSVVFQMSEMNGTNVLSKFECRLRVQMQKQYSVVVSSIFFFKEAELKHSKLWAIFNWIFVSKALMIFTLWVYLQ